MWILLVALSLELGRLYRETYKEEQRLVLEAEEQGIMRRARHDAMKTEYGILGYYCHLLREFLLGDTGR